MHGMEPRSHATIDEIRSREKKHDTNRSGKGVVNFDELRKGNIGLVVATQIARYASPQNRCLAGIRLSRPGSNTGTACLVQVNGRAWVKLRQIHSLNTL